MIGRQFLGLALAHVLDLEHIAIQGCFGEVETCLIEFGDVLGDHLLGLAAVGCSELMVLLQLDPLVATDLDLAQAQVVQFLGFDFKQAHKIDIHAVVYRLAHLPEVEDAPETAPQVGLLVELPLGAQVDGLAGVGPSTGQSPLALPHPVAFLH